MASAGSEKPLEIARSLIYARFQVLPFAILLLKHEGVFYA